MIVTAPNYDEYPAITGNQKVSLAPKYDWLTRLSPETGNPPQMLKSCKMSGKIALTYDDGPGR